MQLSWMLYTRCYCELVTNVVYNNFQDILVPLGAIQCSREYKKFLKSISILRCIKAWLHLFWTTKYDLILHTVSLRMKVPQSHNLHQNESPSVWINMGSQLTTPTCHVMLPSHSQCHCCGYIISKGGDVTENLREWNFGWRLSTVLGNSKKLIAKLKSPPNFPAIWYVHFLRTGKSSLLGGVGKVHFALNAMEACCRFPKIKSWSTKKCISPWSKNRLQQLLQELLLSVDTVISTLTMPHWRSSDKIQQWTKAISKLHIHFKLDSTELFTTSVF